MGKANALLAEILQEALRKIRRTLAYQTPSDSTKQYHNIVKQSKIKAFLTHKVFWNDTNKFPYNVFRWVRPDGDWITAVAYGNGRDGYNSDFTASSVPEQWRNWADEGQPMLYSYGYGDGGGGPNVEMLLRAEAINDLPILPKVDLTSGLNGYLNSVKPTNEWRGELYLETHRSTLTSHSRMKLLGRVCEVALREAELWCSLAGAYDRSRFSGLWLTKRTTSLAPQGGKEVSAVYGLIE